MNVQGDSAQPSVDGWDVSALPTGTVTLLLADVEGSTQLWETGPTEMADALQELNRIVSERISACEGVRPLEQGEGDSFVAAFSRATDAVQCTVDIQRSSPAPIRLRIGIHTGEVQLRDDNNYAGPVLNRAARLRDLAHGGQTVLSTATESLVIERLPEEVWLTELGTYRLRGLPRPERVLQLCHPALANTFPPLRTDQGSAGHNFPVHLTRFVGRDNEITGVRQALATNRLVTLTGAGGIGKTRIAEEIGGASAASFEGGAWFVDLTKVKAPEGVQIAVARALDLPDQPGRKTIDTLTARLGGQPTLLVLDNCEHLLDAVASLLNALFGACPRLVVLATSREHLGVAGEVIWRVPPLALLTEAVDLFIDRAQRVRPQLSATPAHLATITDICRRLDGMPLAIELAAARARSLSIPEIADGLRDRFRLLTGGARTAVHRQQTMQASVAWSYDLLTEPEKALFRRLAVFVGGCDLVAAEKVTAAEDLDPCQVLDLLTLLVDKSLVHADTEAGATRYRTLETVRQFASERLSEHGDSDSVRERHCDYYTSLAAMLDTPSVEAYVQRIKNAELEIDNMQAAFMWSLDSGDIDAALRLVSSLQPVWLATARILQGMAWFDSALINIGFGCAQRRLHALTLANRAILASHVAAVEFVGHAEQALAIAREDGDEALLARALTACGSIAAFDPEVALPYLDEAESLARSSGDLCSLGQVLAFKAYAAVSGAGDPGAALKYGTEGRDISETVGDGSASRWSRWSIGDALYMSGDCAGAVAQLQELVFEALDTNDVQARVVAEIALVYPLTYSGRIAEAQTTAASAVECSKTLSDPLAGLAYAAEATAALAAADLATAERASAAALQKLGDDGHFGHLNVNPAPMVALALGDHCTARAMADNAVSIRKGWHLVCALRDRALVAIAQGEVERARGDAHQALTEIARVQAYQPCPDVLEILAETAATMGNHCTAARLFGSADAIRDRTGLTRLPFFDAHYANSVAATRDTLGEEDFASAWAEGAALSTDDAIAYALRGRGERGRPATGWEALTPTERKVAQFVTAGLANKDIASKMFITVRTVQTHLTHIYAKLGVSSRVQLAQEASRHSFT